MTQHHSRRVSMASSGWACPIENHTELESLRTSSSLPEVVKDAHHPTVSILVEAPWEHGPEPRHSAKVTESPGTARSTATPQQRDTCA
jgi:hypothetical protein